MKNFKLAFRNVSMPRAFIGSNNILRLVMGLRGSFGHNGLSFRGIVVKHTHKRFSVHSSWEGVQSCFFFPSLKQLKAGSRGKRLGKERFALVPADMLARRTHSFTFTKGRMLLGKIIAGRQLIPCRRIGLPRARSFFEVVTR